MTNAELLAKIKAEIERRIAELENDKYINLDAKVCRQSELKYLDRFLDTLEEPVSVPPVCEELNEAAKAYTDARDWAKENYLTPYIRQAFIAGAKWQKEQDEEEQADLFTIVALDAAQRAKIKIMEDFPKWRKIKAGERLPCPAYVWTIAYDNYPDCFEGRLMPNIQGVKVGRDTWYLPVDVIHNLPKED